ncbi:MAG: tetratricopeptide repeat protein [Pseudomonadota bacterium]
MEINNDYKKGTEAFQQKNYQQAFLCYKNAAEQGDAKLQFNLGLMYTDGVGVVRDLKQAVVWYTKAAEQGDVEAQFNVGLSYHQGIDVVQDLKQAADWYKKAADQGFVQAQCNLGVLFQEDGLARNYEKALVWYKTAAEQGDACAQRNIALMYIQGKGVDRNKLKAISWFIKSVYSVIKTSFKTPHRKGN